MSSRKRNFIGRSFGAYWRYKREYMYFWTHLPHKLRKLWFLCVFAWRDVAVCRSFVVPLNPRTLCAAIENYLLKMSGRLRVSLPAPPHGGLSAGEWLSTATYSIISESCGIRKSGLITAPTRMTSSPASRRIPSTKHHHHRHHKIYIAPIA